MKMTHVVQKYRYGGEYDRIGEEKSHESRIYIAIIVINEPRCMGGFRRV